MKRFKFVVLLLAAAMCLAGCFKSAAPVSYSFRRSLMDPAGLVLQVQNTSNESLSLRIVATDNTTQQKMEHIFSLAPYDHVELGIVETNWSFKSGEEFELYAEGHRAIHGKVP